MAFSFDVKVFSIIQLLSIKFMKILSWLGPTKRNRITYEIKRLISNLNLLYFSYTYFSIFPSTL